MRSKDEIVANNKKQSIMLFTIERKGRSREQKRKKFKANTKWTEDRWELRQINEEQKCEIIIGVSVSQMVEWHERFLVKHSKYGGHMNQTTRISTM